MSGRALVATKTPAASSAARDEAVSGKPCEPRSTRTIRAASEIDLAVLLVGDVVGDEVGDEVGKVVAGEVEGKRSEVRVGIGF